MKPGGATCTKLGITATEQSTIAIFPSPDGLPPFLDSDGPRAGAEREGSPPAGAIPMAGILTAEEQLCRRSRT